MFHRSRLLLPLTLLALSFSGCAIDPYVAADWDEIESNLRQGMAPGEVRMMLGEPGDVRKTTSASGSGGIETWVYERKRRSGSTMAPTGTIDVPYVDPFTGQMRNVPEPSYTQVVAMEVEEFHLHWNGGALYQWQRFVRSEVDYDP
jgi:hypothetical protein